VFFTERTAGAPKRMFPVALWRKFAAWVLIGSLSCQSVATASCACAADRPAGDPEGRLSLPKTEPSCCHKRKAAAQARQHASRSASCCCRQAGHVAGDRGPCTCAGFCACRGDSQPEPAAPAPRPETRSDSLFPLAGMAATAVMDAEAPTPSAASASAAPPLTSAERCRTLCRFLI
jgi:hypothetical protein